MKKLSILIPTLPERATYLDRLKERLMPQISPFYGQVEIILNYAGRYKPTGTKRNELLSAADGEYVVSLDDDDLPVSTYVADIMEAIEQQPDVITFCGWMTTNGAARVDFVIRLGEKYEERDGKYYRYPNHIVPMRTELVQNIKFPDIWLGEDYAWCTAIKDAGVLKTEVHIPKMLYHYDFKTEKSYSNG